MKPRHGVGSAAALLLMAFALWSLRAEEASVRRVTGWRGTTPYTLYELEALGPAESRPLVVVAHGFAGSKQLMRSYAVSLARRGARALTFDFLGHGRNLSALPGDITDVEGATRHLVEQTADMIRHGRSLRPTTQVGLLGHSMASDIVVRTAQTVPEVEATVAVSMFSPAVTSTRPENLLVVVGDWESTLKQEAMRVLSMVTEDPAPGVTYGSFTDGTARRAFWVPNAEHVAVLYAPAALREATDWMAQALGLPKSSSPPARRGLPILLLVLALGGVGWPALRSLPRVCEPPAGVGARGVRLWVSAVLPAVATPVLLMEFPPDFLSVLVGGYLAVHFGLYGLLTLGCLGWLCGWRPRLSPPARSDWVPWLGATAAAVAYGAGAVAWALDAHVTSFAIMPPRIPLFFAMWIGTSAYFLADEWLTRGPGSPWWARAVTRTAFLVSLGIAVALSFEDLFFLLLISFIIAVYFIFYGIFSAWAYRSTGHPSVGAAISAVAFAWALAVVFPMLSG